MGLFRYGNFELHSGSRSKIIINCEKLKWEDWVALSAVVSTSIPFREVHGVPRGGTKFAQALHTFSAYGSPNSPVLIADDVLTTGSSMIEYRDKLLNRNKLLSEKDIRGVVLFARGKCPDWVTPIFQSTIF